MENSLTLIRKIQPEKASSRFNSRKPKNWLITFVAEYFGLQNRLITLVSKKICRQTVGKSLRNTKKKQIIDPLENQLNFMIDIFTKKKLNHKKLHLNAFYSAGKTKKLSQQTVGT